MPIDPMFPPSPAPLAPPQFGSAPPMPSAPQGQPQGGPNFLSMALPVLASVLVGKGDPVAMSAGLQAFQKGRDLKREQRESMQEREDRKQRERAEFYSRAVSQANELADPIQFEQWKAAIKPWAEYYQISPEAFTFSDTKRQERDRKMVAEAMAIAARRHGDDVADREDVTLQLSDGRTITMREARQMTGGGVTDASGKPVASVRPDANLRGLQLMKAEEALMPKPADAPTPGSFEEYVNLPPEQQRVREGQRKSFLQSDDRPLVVNTGAADARTSARIDRIVSAFSAHPLVKEYNETQAQQGIIRSVVDGQWSGPGDMAVVFAFMKALDPNSVVRETEYANAAKSGNIFSGWAARFNGGLNPSGGFLSDQVKRDFLTTIDARMTVKTQQYQNLRRQLAERIDRIKAGAPETGDEALVDYTAGAPSAAAAGQKIGDTKTFPNGKKGRWDGTGWELVP